MESHDQESIKDLRIPHRRRIMWLLQQYPHGYPYRTSTMAKELGMTTINLGPYLYKMRKEGVIKDTTSGLVYAEL